MKRRINKNGFTLVEILTVIIILGILVAIAIPAISRYMKLGEERYYKSLEEELVIIGRDYYTKNKNEIPRGQLNSEGIPIYINQVDLNTLKEKGYVTNDIVSTKKEPCTGYVRVENKENNEYEYIGCVKCDNKYTSEKNNAYCTLYENFEDLKNANGALLCNIDTGSYKNNTWSNQDINATVTSMYENGKSAEIGMYKNSNTGHTIKSVNNSTTIKITESGSLKIYTYDRLGNRGECSLDNIKIDKENPSVSFTSSNISKDNNGVKVTATLKDNNGVIAYQVNQSSSTPSTDWTEIKETKETTITTDYLTTSNNNTTYYIWAKDVAGNTSKKRIIVGLSSWSGWTTNYCSPSETCQTRTTYSNRYATTPNYSAGSNWTATPCSPIDGKTCESASGWANYSYIGAAPIGTCYNTTYTCYQTNMMANGCYRNGGDLSADGKTCYKYNQTSCTGNWKIYKTTKTPYSCYYCPKGTLINSTDYGKYMCYSTSSEYFSHYDISNTWYYGVKATIYRTRTITGYNYSEWSNFTDTACTVDNITCKSRTEYKTRTYTYEL